MIGIYQFTITPMNEYEARQEAKRNRLQERARKLREAAEQKSAEGWEALRAIPFGQPILVGHHSEKSDRAYRGRAKGKIDKSVEMSIEADRIQQRADSIGTGGISSDDPDAISKLEAKLLETQEMHAAMMEKNREARLLGKPKIFMNYQLSNSRGRMLQITKRIELLRATRSQAARPTIEGVIGSLSWRISEDLDDNRILFTSTDRPSQEVIALLKQAAFKWSPSRGAWVRQLTPNARYSTDRLIEKLRSL